MNMRGCPVTAFYPLSIGGEYNFVLRPGCGTPHVYALHALRNVLLLMLYRRQIDVCIVVHMFTGIPFAISQCAALSPIIPSTYKRVVIFTR